MTRGSKSPKSGHTEFGRNRITRSSSMVVEIANETGRRVPRLRIRQVAGRAARMFSLPKTAQVQIVCVGDRKMRALNRHVFLRNRPTDVLAFPLHSWPAGLKKRPPRDADGRARLGDVIVSLDTAARQAAAAGRPVSAEIKMLVAHGVLHLLGFDHERPSDARRMEELVTRLISAEG